MSFDFPVQRRMAPVVQVPVPKGLLTALGLLSLLICCSGQWGFASNCSATLRLDQIFASNVTGNYIAVLEIVSHCLSQACFMDCPYDSCTSWRTSLQCGHWQFLAMPA